MKDAPTGLLPGLEDREVVILLGLIAQAKPLHVIAAIDRLTDAAHRIACAISGEEWKARVELTPEPSQVEPPQYEDPTKLMEDLLKSVEEKEKSGEKITIA